MGYKAALNLAEMAKRHGLLGDGLVRTMLRVAALDDDPGMETDVEAYFSVL